MRAYLKYCVRCLLSVGMIVSRTTSQQHEPTLIINVVHETGQESGPPYLNGYRKTLSGQTINYHSSHPDAESALLCRVRRDANSISWETDTLTQAYPGGFYRLVWLSGIERIGWGNATRPHTFHLSINGSRWFTFTNRKDSTAPRWTIHAKDGAALSFESHGVDKYGDLFGYMYLTLPRKDFSPGVPLVLRVDGEDADSPEWYMMFQYRFNFKPRVRVEPALTKNSDGVSGLLRLSLDNLQANRLLEISSGSSTHLRSPLQIGANIFFLPMKAATSDKALPLVFSIDDTVADRAEVLVKPVRRREIYLLSHTHTDIGYTDLQPSVERKQWQHLAEALRLITRTKDYPAESQYKWNIEVLWPLESYLQRATPEKRSEIISAVKNGSIGLNAFLVNPLTGLANAVEMSHFTDYARQCTKEFSVPITTAAVSDIPGFTWGIVSTLAQSAVRYFASAPNNGDRIGYVLETWGDKPFYWASQSGAEKILFWVAGSSYSSFHEGALRNAGQEKIMKLVRKLDESGYPYDMYYLPYTLGDNAGPDSTLSDLVRAWNERFVTPKLIISTHQQLFNDFERRYGATLPTMKGDFTPYWEDGAGSTAYETALNRHAVDRLIQSEALWSMRSPQSYPERSYYHAWRNIVLWDEHTWGADKSVSDPDDQGVAGQWRIKQKYVLDADSISKELMARAVAPGNPGTVLDVFNTNSWTRTDLVVLSKEQSSIGDIVVDETMHRLPSQRLSTGELAVLVRDVAPMSARRITVQHGNAPSTGNVRVSGTTLENAFFSLVLDRKSGAIRSLRWKRTERELVGSPKELQINQYFYVPGTNPDSARPVTNVRIGIKERGRLVSSLLVEADAQGCRHFTSELRLISGIKRLDIINVLDKTAVREKEGVHFAFPLFVPGGRLRYNVANGIVEAGKDQLPGSCKNFFSVESWVDVSNSKYGVTWSTVDAPLIEIGSITAEARWLKSLQSSHTFYSYVMNNYWHTNYKAEQSGIVSFSYSISPHHEFNASDAVRFGIERRQPLLAAPADTRLPAARSLFTMTPAEILVQSIKPAHQGTSYLLFLYNPSAMARHVRLQWNTPGPVKIFSSSPAADEGTDITTGCAMKAHGTQYILVRQQ